MKFKHTQNHFQKCKEITWQDVIEKIDNASFNGNCTTISKSTHAPTIVLDDQYYINSMKFSYEEVKKETGINFMHVYTSLGRNALTFGRHCDEVDVLIVQSVGNMDYKFDCGTSVTIKPGDSLYIPKTVYHDPIVYEPRITLSFSWKW